MRCLRLGLGETGGPEHQPPPHILGVQGWGPRKQIQGTEDAGLGGGPTLRTLMESVPAPPTLPSKQQGRGVGLPGWGCLSSTLTPKNKKLRKGGQALSDSYSKATWIFQGEVTW